jgi:hypothetical protein
MGTLGPGDVLNVNALLPGTADKAHLWHVLSVARTPVSVRVLPVGEWQRLQVEQPVLAGALQRVALQSTVGQTYQALSLLQEIPE